MQCIFGKRERANCGTPTCAGSLISAAVKLLPPADFQLFEAHRLDKRVYLCVGCFGGSRAVGPVFELLRKTGAVAKRRTCACAR